jgi:phage anti-repressor protein
VLSKDRRKAGKLAIIEPNNRGRLARAELIETNNSLFFILRYLGTNNNSALLVNNVNIGLAF